MLRRSENVQMQAQAILIGATRRHRLDTTQRQCLGSGVGLAFGKSILSSIQAEIRRLMITREMFCVFLPLSLLRFILNKRQSNCCA